MKQSKYFSRWKPRYFRLEDGFLTYYDKKSLVGTHKNKVRYLVQGPCSMAGCNLQRKWGSEAASVAFRRVPMYVARSTLSRFRLGQVLAKV